MRRPHRSWWLPVLAAGIAVAGIAWLVLEQALRPGGFSLPRPLLWWLAIPALSLPLLALALRPRATAGGERALAAELLQLVSIAVFAPAAAMLTLYIVAFALSLGAAVLSWLFWGLLALLGLVLQVSLWLGTLGGLVALGVGIARRQQQPLLIGGGLLALVFVISVMASMATGQGAADLWKGGLIRSFAQIFAPFDWDVLLRLLREAVRSYRQEQAIAMVESGALGALVGSAGALGLRRLRQRLMQTRALLPYLPLAAAPLSDGAGVVSDRVAPAVVGWLVAGWFAALILAIN